MSNWIEAVFMLGQSPSVSVSVCMIEAECLQVGPPPSSWLILSVLLITSSTQQYFCPVFPQLVVLFTPGKTLSRAQVWLMFAVFYGRNSWYGAGWIHTFTLFTLTLTRSLFFFFFNIIWCSGQMKPFYRWKSDRWKICWLETPLPKLIFWKETKRS